jgi:hypothetical protein
MPDRVPLEDVRHAARIVVDYLIEDEEDCYRQTSVSAHNSCNDFGLGIRRHEVP